MQSKVFWESEGDAWFQRNREALKTAVDRDWPLRMIEQADLRPQRVLEIGCANGWRLEEIRRRYGSDCYGCDVSVTAIHAGRVEFPQVTLWRTETNGAAGPWRFLGETCDLAIVNFVFHWVARQDVLRTCIEVDRMIDNRGFLIIGDFMPEIPTEVPYHHREGLFTYKADYVSPFLAAGYRIRREVIFNHGTGEQGEDHTIPDNERAHCTLLQKIYQR